MFPRLENAQIDWASTHPSSRQFGDVYYDRSSGLEESRYVFLEQNRLAERFTELNAGHGSHFTVAETGFGTGLNFLLTWAMWRDKVRQEGKVLHFISMERWPLSRTDLEKSLSAWPELQALAAELLAAYPPALRGFHRLLLDQGRVRLTLLLGDATEQLGKAIFKADAWFLDGFAPAKNPDLWTPDLFDMIAARSGDGTTFSTFTAAGVIRRSLQERGFHVEKIPGFGRKREMLKGICQPSEALSSTYPVPKNGPWLLPEQMQSATPKTAIVIGAGLAGCHMAWNLRSRGWSVRVYDHQGIARGASGNPQGVLYTKLGIDYTPQTRLQVASLLFSQRLLTRLSASFPEQDFWNPCGVLQLAQNEAEQHRQHKFLEHNQYPEEVLRPVSPSEASAIAGTAIPHEALYFPQSGAVSPSKFCNFLLESTGLSAANHQVSSLDYDTEQACWLLKEETGKVFDSAPVVIVATATDSLKFPQCNHLPLRNIRGQVTVCPAPEELRLEAVVCGEGYVAPPRNGELCTGATFQHRDDDRQVRDTDHLSNLHQLSELLPEWSDQILDTSTTQLSGRTGFRSASSDYLPLAGPVPNMEGTSASIQPDGSKPAIHYWPGLYISAGHGSKGLATCPLAAELLADMITGQPLCMEEELYQSLSPARFLARQKIRKG